MGYFSDKLACACGKRNTWYYMGSLLVMPSFLFIFLDFSFLGHGTAGQTAWYVTWPAIFNVGWASVQISHLAIVNQLSYSQRKRDQLSTYRNGATYGANILVLSLALGLFYFIDNQTL